MRTTFQAIVTALAATVLVAAEASAIAVPSVYEIALLIEGGFETLGLLPEGWGSAHHMLLGVLALAVAVPPIGWMSVWLYRKAMAHETGAAGI